VVSLSSGVASDVSERDGAIDHTQIIANR
jgi:hypothetical protein